MSDNSQKLKLTAIQRLDCFFDKGTFREIDVYVSHRCTNFGMEKESIPYDGVLTGFGLVNGKKVFAYAQDFKSKGGSLGEMHAKKICKVLDLAVSTGNPVVGFHDSGGARIQEGVDALAGYGEIFYRNTRASGVIPQICAIMGPTAGGAVYSPALMDFIFMVKKSSYMFITGPDVIKSVTGEVISAEELGGADTHTRVSGVSHFACDSDIECIEEIKKLLDYLPPNNFSGAPLNEIIDDPFRETISLESIIPDNDSFPYDMKKIIKEIADRDSFFEVSKDFARNIIIGFLRIGGNCVGVVANQPDYLAGCLDIDASDKASRFIRFCDAFNIPILTIADVPGFLPGKDQEFGGIIRHGAKILWSYSEASVGKILLITRKAYGGAYIAMSSRHLGADLVFSWPKAEIAVMGASGAVEIIHRKALENSQDRDLLKKRLVEDYREKFSNPYTAASRGYIDSVIRPFETRAVIYESLTFISSKKAEFPDKKHGNMPL
ncbi:MAG: acyl-CoA carboxylase subunit beta [Desulforegulaceae bacterium]|nr:acyl-CoA carboxylase subunit beta [Desulforegulaceae bacterium]